MRLPLIGNFSTGKSSFINAFINKQLLSTTVSPETAITIELYFSL
ncbi:hypothetical protein CEP49_08005 [Mergibacter septicus]|nr:hypothetical protein CEP49_08005 [Mergibacter septicus]